MNRWIVPEPARTVLANKLISSQDEVADLYCVKWRYNLKCLASYGARHLQNGKDQVYDLVFSFASYESNYYYDHCSFS